MSAPQPPVGGDAVASLSSLLDRIAGAAPTAPTGATAPVAVPEPAPAVKPAETPKPAFLDLDSFMVNYLAPVVERRLAIGPAQGANWCPRWWSHPEAISRLYALWRAWETLRVADPDTGMSIWWRDHFESHFAVMTGEYGPFAKCSPDRGHTPTTPLPIEPAPPEVLDALPDYEV